MEVCALMRCLPDLLYHLDQDSVSKEPSDGEELWYAAESSDFEDILIESLESDAGSDDVEVVPALVKHNPGDLVELDSSGSNEKGAQALGIRWSGCGRGLKSALHRWLQAPSRVMWR